MNHNLPTIEQLRTGYAVYHNTLAEKLVSYVQVLPDLQVRLPADDTSILPSSLVQVRVKADLLITAVGFRYVTEVDKQEPDAATFTPFEHTDVELLLDLYEVVSAQAEAFLAESSGAYIAALQRLLIEAGHADGELTINGVENHLLAGRFRSYPKHPLTFRPTEIRVEPRQIGSISSPGHTYTYERLTLEELSSLRRILLGFVLLHTVS